MSRLIIGIDIRVLVLGKHTGVEEYLLNLLPRMIEKHQEITFRLFYNALRKQPLPLEITKHPNVEIYNYKIPNRLLLFPLNAIFSWPKIDKLIGGCDVFWSPHIFNVALSKNTQHVVTVHDLAFERHPEFFSKEKLWWHKYLMSPKKQLHRADHLIAVSDSTKKDLQNLYKIPQNKVRVIYPGVGSEYRPLDHSNTALYHSKEKYHLPDNFILYFGTIEPRKNLLALICAFELLKKNYSLRVTRYALPEYKLVIAGTPGWLYKEVFVAAKKFPLANDIIFAGFIDPEDKPALYNLADVFVYPSFFEGFGFPPLEAMACGIPVITSNRSSLPEVVGNAAITIDPYRPAEIAEALRVLSTDMDARKTLIQRGLERAKNFSWDTAAEETFMTIVK